MSNMTRFGVKGFDLVEGTFTRMADGKTYIIGKEIGFEYCIKSEDVFRSKWLALNLIKRRLINKLNAIETEMHKESTEGAMPL